MGDDAGKAAAGDDQEAGVKPEGAMETGQRAADLIVGRIEQRIMSGDLPDRAPLPAERHLMAEFGASRTVVREAVTALANRGLVENRPRFRPIVRKPGYDAALTAVGGIVNHLLGEQGGVRNLYDSRVFLERALVREAAMHARKDDIQELKQALTKNQDAIDQSEQFYETDVAFHGVLYSIPQNPIFPAIHSAYTAWLAPHWIKMERSPKRNRVNFECHQAILDAIMERDPDGAEEALVGHLQAAWEFVRVTFDRDQR